MGHETSYHTEQQNQVEELRRRKTLNEGIAQLNEAGLEAIGELLKGDAVDQIVKYATSIEADLIMLGHKRHGNWLERWWRSSTPKALIEHSPCSVLVVIIKWIHPTNFCSSPEGRSELSPSPVRAPYVDPNFRPNWFEPRA